MSVGTDTSSPGQKYSLHRGLTVDIVNVYGTIVKQAEQRTMLEAKYEEAMRDAALWG